MEQFRAIKDFENYEVSSFGNVKNTKTGRILKISMNTNRYFTVKLSNNKLIKCHRVHRLVAHAFIENPDNKTCVDHIDRNSFNNKFDNLRWVSHSENRMNSKKRSNNVSTCTGVFFDKNSRKWRVQITVNGIKKHVGLYKDLNEAIKSRKEQENIHFGEFQAFQTEMDKLEYEFQQAMK